MPHDLTAILNTLNQVPADAWAQVISIVLSALVVSPAALGLKKWLTINSEKLMLLVVITSSLGAAALVYLQSDPKFGPWIVAVTGGLTFATTQPLYIYLIKPLSAQVGAWFASQVQQAAQLNDVKSAVVPETGLPIGSTAATTNDGSSTV